MRMNRRNVLVGLGTIVVGGGGALATGAFSSVTADRSAAISVADDANAFLSVKPHADRPADEDDPYLTVNEGQIEFYFDGSTDAIDTSNGNRTSVNGDGINKNAVTTFSNFLTITNNGTNSVEITITPMIGGSPANIGFSASYTNNPIEAGGSTDVDFEFDLTEPYSDTLSEVDKFQIEA